ncbi:MAG: hypothetical protein HY716_13745 [Planctomycetes bacterium]|nr:hypothetical protein [Planctomycetota bacterium]
MTFFWIVSFLLPPAAGFLAPAMLAWKPSWKAAAIGHGALCALVAAAGLWAGASIGTVAAVLAFSTAFAALAAGAHVAAGQISSGLIVVVLGSTLFAGGPLIQEAVDRGDAGAIESRMNFLLAVNPYPVMAGSIFHIDVLRQPILYSWHYADYLREIRYPAWWATGLGYLAAAAALAGAGMVRRRWRHS